MPALSPQEVQETFGFDVNAFVKSAKDELGLGPVRLTFDGDTARAHAERQDGVLVIHLPTRDVIQRNLGLNEESVIAKGKASLLEELCHGYHRETSHNDEVVTCTIDMMQRHLDPEELDLPYIREKMRRIQISPDRCPSLCPLPA